MNEAQGQLTHYLIKHRAMKTYGEVEVQICAVLILALNGGERLLCVPADFI
jgi:hypothetical protein